MKTATTPHEKSIEFEELVGKAIAHLDRCPGLSEDRLAVRCGYSWRVYSESRGRAQKSSLHQRLIAALQERGYQLWRSPLAEKAEPHHIYPPGRPLPQVKLPEPKPKQVAGAALKQPKRSGDVSDRANLLRHLERGALTQVELSEVASLKAIDQLVAEGAIVRVGRAPTRYQLATREQSA